MPQEVKALAHLSCSPKFPRASYLDERTLTYEPIVKWKFALRDPSREYWIATTLTLLKKPFQSLGHTFGKPKDPVTKEQRTDAIYAIPHNNFDDKYTRQTKRQFGTRVRFKEHLKAVFFCKKENSALSEHTWLTNHTIGLDKTKIITTNRRYYQRLCLET